MAYDKPRQIVVIETLKLGAELVVEWLGLHVRCQWDFVSYHRFRGGSAASIIYSKYSIRFPYVFLLRGRESKPISIPGNVQHLNVLLCCYYIVSESECSTKIIRNLIGFLSSRSTANRLEPSVTAGELPKAKC